MKTSNTITVVAVAIPLLLAVMVLASRHLAIVRGDAFMQAHLPVEWVRLRCSPILWTGDQLTVRWRVVYETDAITGCPPTVSVSFWGAILQSNVGMPAKPEKREMSNESVQATHDPPLCKRQPMSA